MLKISDVRSPSEPKSFAVIDTSRSIGKGDPGPVLSIHKGQTAATKAAKRIKHSRVVELRNLLKVGDHPNALSDLSSSWRVPEKNSRWL